MSLFAKSYTPEDDCPSFFIQFHPVKWNFKIWLQIVKLTVLRIKTETDRKNYILLKLLNYSVFNELCKTIAPVDPLDLTVEMIISILDKKYSF